jgi:ATP-dependent 26S proteasome regulatory subunit
MKTDRLINHLRSGFSAYWIRTFEPNRIRRILYPEIKEFKRKDGVPYKILEWDCSKEMNPLPTIQSLFDADPCTLLFAYNWHWFSEKPQVVQALQNLLPVLSNQGKAFIAVSAKEKIPFELSKDFILMDLPLPDEVEIVETLKTEAPDNYKVPEGKEQTQLVKACKSLNRTEIEQVLALSTVEKGHYSVEVINDYRAMAIKKTGFIEVIPPNYSFENVIGYQAYKDHVLETGHNPKAKGNMLIGPAGCGKTVLQMAIVGELNKLGLKIEMGSLYSKYEGETDQNIRTVQEILRSIGDCYALFDEFEKQFGAAGSTDGGDAGRGKRYAGAWLDFFQNRPPGCYISGTANSFDGIPSPYLRPGRWDTSPFFVDLPSAKVRKGILEYYCNQITDFDLQPHVDTPDIKDFTGGEIEALVNLADMRGICLSEARKLIIPQIITKGEEITALRNWAKGRCLPAEDIPAVKTDAKRKLDV